MLGFIKLRNRNPKVSLQLHDNHFDLDLGLSSNSLEASWFVRYLMGQLTASQPEKLDLTRYFNNGIKNYLAYKAPRRTR